MLELMELLKSTVEHNLSVKIVKNKFRLYGSSSPAHSNKRMTRRPILYLLYISHNLLTFPCVNVVQIMPTVAFESPFYNLKLPTTVSARYYRLYSPARASSRIGNLCSGKARCAAHEYDRIQNTILWLRLSQLAINQSKASFADQYRLTNWYSTAEQQPAITTMTYLYATYLQPICLHYVPRSL